MRPAYRAVRRVGSTGSTRACSEAGGNRCTRRAGGRPTASPIRADGPRTTAIWPARPRPGAPDPPAVDDRTSVIRTGGAAPNATRSRTRNPPDHTRTQTRGVRARRGRRRRPCRPSARRCVGPGAGSTNAARSNGSPAPVMAEPHSTGASAGARNPRRSGARGGCLAHRPAGDPRLEHAVIASASATTAPIALERHAGRTRSVPAAARRRLRQDDHVRREAAAHLRRGRRRRRHRSGRPC